MLASSNIAPETLGDRNNTDINASPTRIPKRHKRTLRPADSNGIMENGDDSQSETIPARVLKQSQIKKTNESPLETSTKPQPPDRNSTKNAYQLNQTLTPVESSEQMMMMKMMKNDKTK
jgi:hypothetical protein